MPLSSYFVPTRVMLPSLNKNKTRKEVRSIQLRTAFQFKICLGGGQPPMGVRVREKKRLLLWWGRVSGPTPFPLS